MEDLCPNEPDNHIDAKLEPKLHSSFLKWFSRHPEQSAWHRSSPPSSMQDVDSAITSCDFPSVCASAVMYYPAQLDLQLVRDTAVVAAASTDGVQQGTLAQVQPLLTLSSAIRPCLTGSVQVPSRCTVTALAASSTCGPPRGQPMQHHEGPSKLRLQRCAEHSTKRPVVPASMTAPRRQSSLAERSPTRCDTAAATEATGCMLAAAQAAKPDAVANPPRRISTLSCRPPESESESGSEAGHGRPPGNPGGKITGSDVLSEKVLWWPPNSADRGAHGDSGCRASNVNESLLQLHADGSDGPLITAPPSPTRQWMLHFHTWWQPPRTLAASEGIACIAPRDLTAGLWVSVSAREAAHKLRPERLTAVAGMAATPWPGAPHGQSSPAAVDSSAGVAVPTFPDPDPDQSKSCNQFDPAQGTPIWVTPLPTCSSLGDSCASPGQSSLSTPRSSSGTARHQARGALMHVEVCGEHCGADYGDALKGPYYRLSSPVALETGGPTLAHHGSTEVGGLGAGSQIRHPRMLAGGRDRGRGRHVIARSVPQLEEISVPTTVSGAGDKSCGGSRLRRAATGAPSLKCSPTQQQSLPGLHANGSSCGGDGGCLTAGPIVRSSSSPLSSCISS
ncbi:hypothetical protein Vafri_19737, partial [Volvox africanus]